MRPVGLLLSYSAVKKTINYHMKEEILKYNREEEDDIMKKKLKKQVKITTKAYVPICGELVDMDTLNKKQRNYIGQLLNYQGVKGALGSRGEAKLPKLPPKEKIFPEFFKK